MSWGDESGDDLSDDPDHVFYTESISEHLSMGQLSMCQLLRRRRVVKFKFAWYQLIPDGRAEKHEHSGMIYRDQHKGHFSCNPSWWAIRTHYRGPRS
jgi:hypothetical protein